MQYDVGPAMLTFDTIARPCVQVARKGLVDAVTTENYQYSPGMVRLRGVWSTLQKKSIADVEAELDEVRRREARQQACEPDEG